MNRELQTQLLEKIDATVATLDWSQPVEYQRRWEVRDSPALTVVCAGRGSVAVHLIEKGSQSASMSRVTRARRRCAGGLCRLTYSRLPGQDDEGVDVDSRVPGSAEYLYDELV
jgi:hypothetical protein